MRTVFLKKDLTIALKYLHVIQKGTVLRISIHISFFTSLLLDSFRNKFGVIHINSIKPLKTNFQFLHCLYTLR